jgi:DNA polymerase III delta subunit
MKIIILHGDDTEKSYARLKRFVEVARQRSWEVSYIDESDKKIEEALSSVSLFGLQQFFILKDVKKLGKKEFKWLARKYTELSGNLIIYHEGTLNATFLKNFPEGSKIEEFKLPVLLWNFLDNLVPGRSTYSVKTFHKILERQHVEFIFTLIARHFRDLYWVKTDAATAGFPFWKISRLRSQSSKFSVENLRKIIGVLSDIDIEVKISKSDLVSELDLFIIKHLE